MSNEVPGLPRLRYPSGVTVPEALPQKLGPYRLHRRLGVGGMAETFVASREDAPELVCVKKVLPAFARDRAFVEQFQREAMVAGHLRHPNVVALMDYGADEGELFMAMELVEGIDLAELLQAAPGRRLPTDVAALVVHDLALGLGHAHRAAIVHRDVTPSNVLLGRDGRVKLADFGVAKALTSTTAATATGFLKGKVPYMAPEYIQGQGVSPKIDLFSLGVVLYECLAGRRPFVGSNDVEVMMRLMTTRPARLDGVAEELADLAARLLDRDPTVRSETAEDVASHLTAHFDLFESRARLVDRIGKVARAPIVVESWSRADVETSESTSSVSTPSTAVMNPLAVALPDRTAVDLRTPIAEIAPAVPSGSRNLERLRLVAGLLAVVLGAVVIGVWAWWSREPEPVGVAPRDEGTPAAASMPGRPQSPEEPEREEHVDEPALATEVQEPLVNDEPNEAETRPITTERGEPSAMREERTRPVSPRTTERRDTATHVVAPPPDAPSVTPSPTPPLEPEPLDEGVMEIVVVPWGFVWIDGRRVGRSPVRTTVSAGTHTVRAGFEGPTTRAQRVEVPRGSTRRLELVIED
jgi:serine/threonine protein kinase